MTRPRRVAQAEFDGDRICEVRMCGASGELLSESLAGGQTMI